jgi:xanthine dehydrogenase YagR molybdenum-binding subunit
MANTPDYSWPPMGKRKVMGQRLKRIDGPQKASGRAKYGSDQHLKGMLFAAYVTCPHAHARVTAVDTGAAEKMSGVKAVHVMAPAGQEIQWAGWEVAAVAATTEEIAKDAVKKIQVTYEAMPHLVREDDLSKAENRSKKGSDATQGDPDKAFQEAEVVSEGEYGIPVVTHCTLETHGQVIQWQGDNVLVWSSTQNITDYASSLAQNLKIPATNIRVKQDHIGGGFGSKFSPDAWALVGAELSRKAGGAPVKVFLNRATDQQIAGNRPSAFAKIKLGGKKDGTVTVWQSDSWGTGGITSVGGPPQPYVYTGIPNKRTVHTQVLTNNGPQRAWRAPGNQQASFLTCGALDDFAAKAGLDPLEVFKVNAQYAPQARVETYRYQLDKAAELAEWKKLWKPRGTAKGTVRRGLGIGIGAWAGMGHASQCRATINPDGSVLVEIGTQDLGTGTRTIINQVAAETFGLQLGQVKVAIGDNALPRDGASGGSTTVGGVSTSTRKATMNALAKLYDTVAPALGAQPEDLEAVDGQVRVKSNPAKRLAWKAACQKLGTTAISEMGTFNGRDGGNLLTQGAAGAQIADVNVDTETGIVTVNRYTAVHDCGLVVNPRLAESQCHGAIVMGISTALFEERIMDEQTGRMLNPDMEFYKLAGIADIGNIVVHMDIRPEMDQRGVIGLGEPPAIPICAAMSNAVANALGVRVPRLPLTPDRVLAVLEGRNA